MKKFIIVTPEGNTIAPNKEILVNNMQVLGIVENVKNENETIEFIENFGYSERTLFYRDTFIQAINKLLEESGIGQLDEKSFDKLINDCHIKSFTGSYLKITHDTFAD